MAGPYFDLLFDLWHGRLPKSPVFNNIRGSSWFASVDDCQFKSDFASCKNLRQNWGCRTLCPESSKIYGSFTLKFLGRLKAGLRRFLHRLKRCKAIWWTHWLLKLLAIFPSYNRNIRPQIRNNFQETNIKRHRTLDSFWNPESEHLRSILQTRRQLLDKPNLDEH